MSGDDNEWTCGRGMAANAVLPERIANLLAAIGTVLDNHTRSLDSKNPDAKREIMAYRRVIREHRAGAQRLAGLAETMKSYRELPTAEHDIGVLTDEKSVGVMAAFVGAEEELLSLLRDRVAEHGAMLEQMKHA